MKRQQILLNKKMLTTLFGLIALFCYQLAIASPSNGMTAFVNVDVVPMDGDRVLRDYTVVINGQRITDIGPAGEVVVPATAKQIKARGKYLMPGLAEMHGHIYVPEGDAHADIVEAMMFLYVANGVTTVRGMFGLPGQQELKARTNSGELIGPSLYLAAPPSMVIL